MKKLIFLLLTSLTLSVSGQSIAEKYMWKNSPDTTFFEKINGEYFLIELVKQDSLTAFVYITMPKEVNDVDKYRKAITTHLKETTGRSFNQHNVLSTKYGRIELKELPNSTFYVQIIPPTDPITGQIYMVYNAKVVYLY